jgi:hypothetical protein
MIRNSLLGILLLTFLAATTGCGQAETGRNDMPVKASPAINPKTGKASKMMEASLEDPPRK